MSTHDSEHGHIIEVCGDVPAMETSQVGSKVCAEAPCGFSDARYSSKDARERSTSMKKLLIEILGALVSIQIIWLLAGILVYEAIDRLINGTNEVNGFLMFIVAAIGLLVNIAMALLLGQVHSHSHGHGHSPPHDDDDDDDDGDDAHEHSDHAHSHKDHGDSYTHGITIKKHHHHHHGEDSKGHADQHHGH